jgi:hypothetical protein
MILSSHGIIGSSIVQFDPDALAFFARVDAATGVPNSLSATEKTATNQLVLDLKANSLWTPMKAIYPMVGASAAACAQNLKSSSFTGTFNGGWTFASTGATPNGSTGWMQTNLNVNTLAIGSMSLGYYSRTDTQTQQGHYIDASTSASVRFGIANFSGLYYVYLSNTAQFRNTSQLNSLGFFQGYRNNTTNVQGYKNSTKIINNAAESISSLANKTFEIGRNSNLLNGYTNEECAFAYIGDGITDTEASNFYTAVQAFQTTLSRNV